MKTDQTDPNERFLIATWSAGFGALFSVAVWFTHQIRTDPSLPELAVVGVWVLTLVVGAVVALAVAGESAVDTKDESEIDQGEEA